MLIESGRESRETAVCHSFLTLPHPHTLFKFFPSGRKMSGLFHPLNFLFLTWIVAIVKSLWVFFVLFLIFMEFVSL